MSQNKGYKYIHIIVSLLMAVAGGLCMWLGTAFIQNIGSVMLISGIYTIIDNMVLRQSLIDLVVEKVKLDKEIDDAGLVQIDSTLTNIDYKSYIKNAKKNIDIIHNYARTWTTNNFDFVKEVVMNKECKVRIALLNPDSPFVTALERHYEYADGELVNYISEATRRWQDLYEELQRKKEECKKRSGSTYKNKTCGELDLYYFNGQPTCSFYRIDNTIIVVPAKNSREKSVYLPYYIFRNNGDKGLYNTFEKEIENIFREAEKVEL